MRKIVISRFALLRVIARRSADYDESTDFSMILTLAAMPAFALVMIVARRPAHHGPHVKVLTTAFISAVRFMRLTPLFDAFCGRYRLSVRFRRASGRSQQCDRNGELSW